MSPSNNGSLATIASGGVIWRCKDADNYYIARANAYGHILLGMDRPVADVSRGSNPHDILGVAAIVGVQAITYNQLYSGVGQRLPGETSKERII